MTASLTSAAFQTLAGLLKTRSGLVIGQDKIYLLETRLGGILRREKLADLNALADALKRPGADAVGSFGQSQSGAPRRAITWRSRHCVTVGSAQRTRCG